MKSTGGSDSSTSSLVASFTVSVVSSMPVSMAVLFSVVLSVTLEPSTGFSADIFSVLASMLLLSFSGVLIVIRLLIKASFDAMGIISVIYACDNRCLNVPQDLFSYILNRK